MSAALQQIYDRFEAAEIRAEEALQYLKVATELIKEAEELMSSTGEWGYQEMSTVSDISYYWERTRLGIDNLTEMYKVAIERMWKSFPKI